MDYIIGFFKEIASVLGSIFDFIAWLIGNLISALGLCLSAIGTAAHYLLSFPAVLAVPFTAAVTIAIIFKLRG